LTRVRCPSEDWDAYMTAEEQAAMGNCADKLEALLKTKAGGRNPKCWRIASFDWKDADLEPEGCGGIKELRYPSEDQIDFVVGCHKTICPTREDLMDVATDVLMDTLSGFWVEWLDDEWVVSTKKTLTTSWAFDDYNEVDYDQTAEQILSLASEALKEFRELAAEVDNLLEELRDVEE